MMMATLLIISIAAPAKAPEIPAWPTDLPLAERHDDGSIELPPVLAEAVKDRLLLLDAYPGMCQRVVESAHERCEVRLRATQRLTEANIALERAENPAWSTWHVVLAGGLGTALGAALGVIIFGASF